jgi:hypothetical protein
MALSTKQQAFVECYLATWNAAEAARRAGYSEKTARSIGAETLTKPDIQAAISARLAELKLTADEVLVRVGEQARGSIAPFLRRNAAGEFFGFNLSDEQPLHLIRKLTVKTRRNRRADEEETTTSLELYSAQDALFKLGEHHQLWGKAVDVLKYIDLAKLSPEQLERIANGEDPLAVLLASSDPAAPSKGGA